MRAKYLLASLTIAVGISVGTADVSAKTAPVHPSVHLSAPHARSTHVTASVRRVTTPKVKSSMPATNARSRASQGVSRPRTRSVAKVTSRVTKSVGSRVRSLGSRVKAIFRRKG